MNDGGNEGSRPKLRLIKGGKDESTPLLPEIQAMEDDLQRIAAAANLKPDALNPSAIRGHFQGYEIIIERYKDSVYHGSIFNFTLNHPQEDPEINSEGFVLKDGKGVIVDERYKHTQLRKDNETSRTFGIEAKGKINDTLMKTKQLVGIEPTP